MFSECVKAQWDHTPTGDNIPFQSQLDFMGVTPAEVTFNLNSYLNLNYSFNPQCVIVIGKGNIR